MQQAMKITMTGTQSASVYRVLVGAGLGPVRLSCPLITSDKIMNDSERQKHGAISQPSHTTFTLTFVQLERYTYMLALEFHRD